MLDVFEGLFVFSAEVEDFDFFTSGADSESGSVFVELLAVK